MTHARARRISGRDWQRAIEVLSVPNKLQALLFGSVARRILTLAALALLCAVCGLMMGRIILDNFDARETADIFKGVTYASVALALWKLIADSWHVLWRFLGWNENRQALIRPLGQLAVAVTGIGLVAGYARSERPQRDPALVIASSVYIGGENIGLDAKRILLPYFTTRPGEEHESRKSCDAYIRELAKLDAAGQDAVKTLACGLRACSTTKQRVIVDVRGFASSLPVECEGHVSDSLNLQIAELRRSSVLKLLQEKPSPDACRLDANTADLEITHGAGPKRWKDLKEMKKFRDLLDVSEGDSLAVDPAREILTRRVDVVIESAGGCRVESTQSPQIAVAAATN
jgi:hypothetical protein